MNGEYIKKMDFDKFYERALPFVKEGAGEGLDHQKIAEMVKSRIEVFPDIPEQISFFKTLPNYELSLYENKKAKCNQENSLSLLEEVLPLLQEE